MNEHEHKWIETNNAVCALLKEAHDALALNSLPPKRRWADLTDEDLRTLADKHLFYQMEGYEISGVFAFARAIEATLKEKNHANK